MTADPGRQGGAIGVPVQDAGPEDCQTVGGAALARSAGGVVTDAYGFLVARQEDLLPR